MRRAQSSVFPIPSEGVSCAPICSSTNHTWLLLLQMHLYQPVLYDERGSPAHSSTAVCATLCAPPAPHVHFQCPAHTSDPLCAGLPPCAYLRLPVRTSATLKTYLMPCRHLAAHLRSS
ncbi:hypothetical protein OBBRIDRAFT_793506 [Obba rivulosa]|uniref:Uncharacterized protein n=1 Tax=Obba rivulosa TaxID=1052685 RepID=A0A8E2ATP7_9APHY|nr:hypothetical protein OBBRIDRAFT_793506 [Obba rivulosa]